jgi:putative flippase GtrA
MTTWHNAACRFARYNLVGFMGVALKFGVLVVLMEFTHAGYVIGTVVAVEAALVHNYCWHVRWTWRDRCAGQALRMAAWRLLQFQFGTGGVALAANLLVMRVMVEQFGLHYGAAGVAATVCAGIANFLLANCLIFAAARRSTCQT